jgi:hypothetical protein
MYFSFTFTLLMGLIGFMEMMETSGLAIGVSPNYWLAIVHNHYGCESQTLVL